MTDLLEEYTRSMLDPLRVEVGLTHLLDEGGPRYGFLRVEGHGQSLSVCIYPENGRALIRMLESVVSVMEGKDG